MIAKEEWEETNNKKCYSCKVDFCTYLKSLPSRETYGIRCACGEDERNIWFCKECWIVFAGEENQFWDFSRDNINVIK